MTNTTEQDRNTELRDANSCIAFGAGLGAVGTGTALLAGATCPLCVVFAPALIGYGVWKRITANRERCVDPERKEAGSRHRRRTD
jgi:hypothetical protein